MIFINGIASISPQKTTDNSSFLTDIIHTDSTRLFVHEPDYSSFIDPRQARRMSRVLKFGTAAGIMALKDADISSPDSISTGTGLGLLEDSVKFLKSIIESEEEMLSPTSFIQSTHNTVSGNLALITQCFDHNFTFSQRGFSLESAIIDAKMNIEDGLYSNVLVGSYDETTDESFQILKRLNFFDKKTPIGEGAHFFVFSNYQTEKTYAEFADVSCQFNNSENQLKIALVRFLEKNKLNTSEIDAVMLGTIDLKNAKCNLLAITTELFSKAAVLQFKHLGGEYMTAVGFGLYCAAQILNKKEIPSALILKMEEPVKPKNILIINEFFQYKSFMLLKSSYDSQ